MAQTIKLKRSASQGAAPSTSNLELGEVAINTYDGKMYIKKDVGGTESIVEIGGGSTVSYLEAGMIEYEYTATSNQTTFSGSDTNSATLSYTANSIMVFLNGVLQDDGVDYTATNGTSVVFTSALTANDEVRIVAFTNVTTSGSLQDPTKLDAITTVNAQAAYSLTLDSSAYVPSSQNALIVSLNGITQEPGDSFTISGSTITFSPALVTGDVVDYIVDMGRAVTIGEYSGDLAVGGELEVTGDIIGDLRGATLFKAQAGESLAKGDVVYISGISGNTTVVSKADADDAAKMPAFGLVAAAASSGNPVDVYTFGELSGLDTSSFSEGDELFVSTTAGTLTNSAPTGESSKLQKIAKVTRSDNSAGSVFIMGAGRSNAVPNLDDGDIFIGNASNQAVTASLNTKIEDYLDAGTSTPSFSTINSGNITTTGYIAGPSTFTIDPAAVGDNTGTLVVAGNLQVDGTTTTINSTTMTVDDLNITLASGAANAAAANGAGITVDGASATLTYNGTNDDWNFNKALNVTGNLTSTGTITSGDITISESTPFLRIQDTDVTNGYIQIFSINGNGYIGSRNDSADGSILIGGYGGGSFTEFARWSDAGHLTQKNNLIVQGAFTSLGIDDNASSTIMTIASTGETTFTGDVVISEATPAITLDDADNADGELKIVQSTGTSFYRTRGATGNGAHVFQRNDGTNILKIFQTNTSGDVIFYENDGVTSGLTWDASASKLTNFTSTGIDDNATSTAITIDASENVGIGTSSPSELLDVGDHTAVGNRNIRISQRTGTGNVTYGGLQFYYNNTAGTEGVNAAIYYAAGPLRNDGELTFHTGASGSISERLRIDHNGNVGIGNTSPSYKLDVDVGAPASSDQVLGRFSSQNGVRDIGFVWDDSTSTLGVATLTNHALTFHTNGNSNERMRIDSSGNVGINQTPNAWRSLDKAIEFQYSSINDNSGTLSIGRNHYLNSAGNWIAKDTTTATVYQQADRAHKFWQAGTTTSGSSISYQRIAQFDQDGLKFGNDTAAANALDDYEEGAFNVAFAGVTGTSYNQQNTYVKVGNTVTVHIRVFMSSQPTSITAGDLEITGLPFSAGEDAVGSVMAYRTEAGSDNSNVIAIIAANTSSIKFTHNGFDNITNYTLFQNSVLDSAFGSNRNVFIITLSYNLIAG